MPRRPDVLAPAGDRACLEAALRAGADAVYFGLQAFNARARAHNFDVSELPALMRHVHAHDTKGYVTLNTLVFDHELAEMEGVISACAAAGVDAVIVQDMGVAELCQAIAPQLPLHASTQMTCTDAGSVKWAQALGARRVVLARELSLDDIAAIRAETEVELEVFVHGALCVAYSGQCLTSEALGGRSANRGACAQACRLPYDLLVDGKLQPLGDKAYLLSPQDLEASAFVPALIEAGISCFKIEGRLKGPDYVAATTRLYRAAIDAAVDRPVPRPALTRLRDLAASTYSRGSGPGFLAGVDHQSLVEGRHCEHRGVAVGVASGLVRQHGKTLLALRSHRDLQRGDGLLVEGGRAGAGERGGRIWGLFVAGREVESAHAEADVLVWLGPDVRLDGAPSVAGRRVFRSDAPRTHKDIEAEVKAAPRTGLHLRLRGHVGQLPVFEATTDSGLSASVKGDTPLVPAHERPLSFDAIKTQLERLGDSPFQLDSLTVDWPPGVMLPFSSLNRARRALVENLLARRHRTWPVASASARPAPTEEAPTPAAAASGLFVLCRTLPQAQAALTAGADGVYLDFLELTGTGEALRQLRADGARFVGVAPPRIRKPGEEKIDRYLRGLRPDGVLIRGWGALAELEPSDGAPAYVGDFSLNVTNRLAAARVLRAGLSAFTPSFDLDARQLQALCTGTYAAHAEVVVHHPMPLFHMEHCVFAALLSEGRDHRTCGRPCERHQLTLRDRAGMEHPVEADVGCRNTVFHAAPQSAAAWLPALAQAGVRRFRVELVRESPEHTTAIVRTYRALRAGDLTALAARKTLSQTLKATGGYGVVSGSLRVL
ncbi:MAG: U32 family peptidase [Myxococcales bacterium]|nr:U32 family peptidase [Myxococcales bacterium]